MRTFHVRSLCLVVVAVLALTPNVTAQGKPPALLSASEVQQLIARAEPADHARLRAHFAALADQDAAEAQRHTAMQQAYAGNTKLAHIAGSMSAHCKRLADLSRASAAAFKDLSTEHGKLASVASEPGAGSRTAESVPTRAASDNEVTEVAMAGNSAADHQRLEQHFLTLAARYDREATDHAAYAKSWRSTTKVSSAPAIAAHCDRVATERRAAAQEARAAASMHKAEAATAK